ncbi:MAG: hypothetical protein R6W88_10710, partial [Desulfobacterales bacterium]
RQYLRFQITLPAEYCPFEATVHHRHHLIPISSSILTRSSNNSPFFFRHLCLTTQLPSCGSSFHLVSLI